MTLKPRPIVATTRQLAAGLWGRVKPWLGHILVALHVACLLSMLHFHLQGEAVDNVYDRLVAGTVRPGMSEGERALALMATTHRVQWATKALMSPKDTSAPQRAVPRMGPLAGYLRDARWALGVPEGACGSFSAALATALSRAGIAFRLVQMLCNGREAGGACHILLEAQVDGRWVVLDPLFNQAFRRPDGKLASYAEVSADWDTYKRQIPAWRRQLAPADEQHYDVDHYDYAGVRYTNWKKIPVLMPALRAVLVAIAGEAWVSTLSLRSHVMDANTAGFAKVAVFYGVLCLWTLLHVVRGRAASGARRRAPAGQAGADGPVPRPAGDRHASDA